jgi:DNA-binding MarR family transcriptional regulator
VLPEADPIGRPATHLPRGSMKNTTRLMGVARLCLAAHKQLHLRQLLLLLAVAERPGRTQTELAHEVGLTLGAVSRAIDVLGTTGRRDKRGAPGMGWIEAVADPHDDRNLLVFLLPKGRELVKQLEQELG